MVSNGDPWAAERNEERYKAFVRSRPELVILMEHDVLVRLSGKRGAMRKHRGKEGHSWRRLINIMDATEYLIRALGFERTVRIFDMLAYHR